MVKTVSTMLPLGTPAPDFSLLNVNGETVSRDDFKNAPAMLVMFMCNHCPFVIHLAPALAQFALDYHGSGLAIVGISSNDVSSHPQDSPEQMIHEAEQRGYAFPYLYDEEQEVAIAYRAACTPDFFLFDGEQKLVYRGQFDSSRPDSGIPVRICDRLSMRSWLDRKSPASKSQALVAISSGRQPLNRTTLILTGPGKPSRHHCAEGKSSRIFKPSSPRAWYWSKAR